MHMRALVSLLPVFALIACSSADGSPAASSDDDAASPPPGFDGSTGGPPIRDGGLPLDAPAPDGSSHAPGAPAWANRFGGPQLDVGFRTAFDPSGRIFLTGGFASTIDFGGGTLTATGGGDVFLAAFAPDGKHLFSHRFGGTDPDFDLGSGIGVLPGGDLVLCGNFWGTIDFGGGTLTSAGLDDVFLSRFDAGGAHVWSHSFGGTGLDLARDVAIDASGSATIAGGYMGSTDFGGGPLPGGANGSSVNVFVARYGGDGAHVWSHGYSASAADLATDVAVDASGAVFTAGHFAGSIDFGDGALTSAGYDDVFVAKLAPGGDTAWSHRFGGAGSDDAYAVAIDSGGGAIVVGKMQQTVDFGASKLTSAGANDVLVLSLAPDGSTRWAKRFGGPMEDRAWSVAVAPNGDLVVGGLFSGTVDFGGGAIGEKDGTDGFALGLTKDGAFRWALAFHGMAGASASGSAAGVGALSIAFTPSGSMALAGAFAETTDVGTGPLVSAGSTDALLAKY